ncbi:MAG: hypothetical protein ACTSSG_04900 [Candidatus Heimdallarchaeaceae archaeon]
MKFSCKKCGTEFNSEYKDLFDFVKCPNCKTEETVLYVIKQGILPPEAGFGISYFEFEDVLEEGEVSYLIDFFKGEFNLHYTRTGDEFILTDKSGKEVNNLKEIYEKTQKDGKLQRMIYNIYYLLLQE